MLHSHIHTYAGYILTQWITDARRIKTQDDFFNNIYLSLYCKGSKGFCGVLYVRGSWRPNITEIFWPQTYGRHVVSLSFSRAAQPEAQGSLCWVIYYILSATSQVPKLHRGSRGPLRPGVAFFTTTRPLRLELELQLYCISTGSWNSNSTGSRTPWVI